MAKVIILAGLGYGDEGKGTTTDWLCRETKAKLVVRYNGGAQCAHNVVETLAHERHHTFAQFGSGTFANVPTHISRHMLINPLALESEWRHLNSLKARMQITIDRDCVVTTPYHVAANRIREMARAQLEGSRHGSCGMGIGETRKDHLDFGDDVLFVRDFCDKKTLRRKLSWVRDLKHEQLKSIACTTTLNAEMEREWSVLNDADLIENLAEDYDIFDDYQDIVDRTWLDEQLLDRGTIIFEGAQGVLLDEVYGFQPHTTWTNTTFDNAYDLIGPHGYDVFRLGVVRAYMTRHGAGPFVTEDERFTKLSEHDHNKHGDWQQGFRSGAFDCVATQYAIDILGGVDGIVMTNVDRLWRYSNCDPVPVCGWYEGDVDPSMFSLDGKYYNRIIPKKPEDYPYQEKITRELKKAKPVYDAIHVETVKGGISYAEHVTRGLGVPLVGVSYGPTEAHKQSCDPNFAKRFFETSPSASEGSHRLNSASSKVGSLSSAAGQRASKRF